MFVFESPKGRFVIEANGEQWRVKFRAEDLGSYRSPFEALANLLSGRTLRPSCGDASSWGLPDDLSKWELRTREPIALGVYESANGRKRRVVVRGVTTRRGHTTDATPVTFLAFVYEDKDNGDPLFLVKDEDNSLLDGDSIRYVRSQSA